MDLCFIGTLPSIQVAWQLFPGNSDHFFSLYICMCCVYSLYTYADMHTSVFDALLWDVKRCHVRSILVLVLIISGIIKSSVSSSQLVSSVLNVSKCHQFLCIIFLNVT